MVIVCGIDEAGRGPVLGSLVIAGVTLDEKDLDKLETLGVKDSKLLTKEKREELFEKIKELVLEYKIIKVSPSEIDHVLEKTSSNLNWLEADKSIEIIDSFKEVDKAIIDCPSSNCEKYENYVKKSLNNDVELVVEHKADFNYLIVAAASILAKVVRDREMEEIKKKYGDCGPGYPSNSITMKFVRENIDKYPEIFRRSWATFKREKGVKKQKSLGDYGS